MDIRNFFGKGKKGGGGGPPADGGKKKQSTSANNDTKANKAKSRTTAVAKSNAKAQVAPAATKGSNKRKEKSPPPPKKRPEEDEEEEEEEVVVVKSKKTLQKKKLVIDDDDSDATIDVFEPVSTKQPKKDEESDATTGADEEKPPPSANKKKKQTDTGKRKEISSTDFFDSSKRASPRKRSQQKKSYVELDSEEEEEEEEEIPVKKTFQKKKTMESDDEDFDFDDINKGDSDEELDAGEEEEPKKKRSSPRATKRPPVKKQKVVELQDDSDEVVKSDDNDENDDDDYEESKAKSSRKKRAASPKKSPPSAAKKRKTPPSSSSKKKTPAKPKKEDSLEPTLELESFDTELAASECLQGLTFVFTGVLSDDKSREHFQEYVKTLGGRVTTAVSSKTTYLVAGEVLEDGRNYTEGKKYQTALDNGVTKIILGEKKLYGLAKLYSDKAKAANPSLETGKENSEIKNQPASAPKTVVNNPYAKKPAAAVVNPYAKNTATIANPYAKKPTVSNPYAQANKAGAPAAKQEDHNPPKVASSNDLWVDRFAPTSTRDILGNKDNVNKLTFWLASWEAKFNNEKAVGKAFSNPKGPWKAALLSGPPGIGKTTTASLVAKEAGRDLIEFNASDVRSKKVMHENLGDITGSQSVEGYFTSSNKKGGKPGGKKSAHKKRVIIMDEVDGMGGGDRGGMAELIQMIKNSRVPIICICNDRQSQKMKSLVPYCLDLRFRRPVKTQIATAAIRIAEQEGLRVERNAAEAIAASCGNDIRQVLNCLQMWSSESKKDKIMTYKGLKERENEINKDDMLRVNLFEGSKLMLEGRRGLSGATPEAERESFFKRCDAFFVDYSFTGLIVQQNYLKVMNPQYQEANRTKDPKKVEAYLDRMHAAAEAMSDFAMVENKIRGGSDMNWSLLPFAGTLAVKTGFHAGGTSGCLFPGFPEFTTWLGRNSSKGKKARIIGELNHHMNYKISGGTQEVRLSYLPFLRDRLMSQLKDPEDDNANNVVIEMMDSYGLDRDDVFENLDEFKMDAKAQSFADIDSKKKAAFTRAYNAVSHKSQALVDEQGAPSKKKKKGDSTSVDPEDPDAIDDDAVQPEESDDDEEEDLEKLKAMFKKKGRKAGAGGSKPKGGAAKGRKKK